MPVHFGKLDFLFGNENRSRVGKGRLKFQQKRINVRFAVFRECRRNHDAFFHRPASAPEIPQRYRADAVLLIGPDNQPTQLIALQCQGLLEPCL